MEFTDYRGKAGREALINELKGNLFEYIVGHQLSRLLGIEKQFIDDFDSGLKDRFFRYESKLRQLDPELLRELPKMAVKVAEKVVTAISLEDIEKIFVIGKLAGDKKETDLMLEGKGKRVPIGLKLCKENSFVNTKSGGIKSFIARYFSLFEDSVPMQNSLNFTVTNSFMKMALRLHEIADLPFEGGFGSDWTRAGYTELPGELNIEMREVVHNYYHELISGIYQVVSRYLKEDRNKFSKSLSTLLGSGLDDLVQVTCFHSGTSGSNRYQVKQVVVSSIDQNSLLTYAGNEGPTISPPRRGRSSFEIIIGSVILQIRVKPMNKFTAASVKINCSVKLGTVPCNERPSPSHSQ